MLVYGFALACLTLGAGVIGAWSLFQKAQDHETSRWAVIEDINLDRIDVEPTSDHVWSELVQLYNNGTEMWVGGIVERYDNKWGFRFKPDSVTVAEVTAEGLQTTITGVSADIDYWLNLGQAYVWSKVVEIHPKLPGDLNDDGVVDIFDVVIGAKAFGSSPGDPSWNQIADLNNDGVVDIFDTVLLAQNFGKTV